MSKKSLYVTVGGIALSLSHCAVAALGLAELYSHSPEKVITVGNSKELIVGVGNANFPQPMLESATSSDGLGVSPMHITDDELYYKKPYQFWGVDLKWKK